MYKIVGIVIVLILLFVGGIFAFNKYIGDVRPIISNPSNLAETVENGAVESSTSGTLFKTKSLPFELEVDEDFTVATYADGLGKVRDLTFSPEGILLASVPSEGRVIALIVGEDGSVSKKVVVDELNGPHGIAFNQGKLFIAEETNVSRYIWNGENTTATLEKELFKVSGGGHDAHTIVFDKDNNLFVKVGSVCNVCIETDKTRATILKSDSKGTNPQVYATGIRNAAFMTIHPESGELWATENGRDMLGDDLPQEEVNIITEGKNYGWPNCYGNRVVDTSFYKGASDICANTELPTVLMQAHSAPLGLNFIPEKFSQELNGDLLVAYHGSWNRSTPTGYKLVRVNIESGQVKETSDFLTGFIQGSSAAGRPVDVEFDHNGNLFVSDDKYGAVYVISPK